MGMSRPPDIKPDPREIGPFGYISGGEIATWPSLPVIEALISVPCPGIEVKFALSPVRGVY
jgi:hypothetical protein